MNSKQFGGMAHKEEYTQKLPSLGSAEIKGKKKDKI